MTETSKPWSGKTIGDCGPYLHNVWSDMFRYLYTYDRTEQGVLYNVDNDLVGSGTSTPVAIATGHALVDGKKYQNDASVPITIPTPSAGNSRKDRIVLRSGYTAQTIRITRIAGTEAPAPSAPAITQSDGVTWDIKLYIVTITDAGVISLTDEREYVFSPLSLLAGLVEDGPTNNYIFVADDTEPLKVKFQKPPIRYAQCVVVDFETEVETGNGQFYIHIPAELNGYNLVSVHGMVITAGTTGTLDFQLYNFTDSQDMLSTKLTIDSGEKGSDTAATPAVIDTTHDDVATNDVLRCDIDAVQTTKPEGFVFTAGFQLP